VRKKGCRRCFLTSPKKLVAEVVPRCENRLTLGDGDCCYVLIAGDEQVQRPQLRPGYHPGTGLILRGNKRPIKGGDFLGSPNWV